VYAHALQEAHVVLGLAHVGVDFPTKSGHKVKC
jgi:hypothetical protein